MPAIKFSIKLSNCGRPMHEAEAFHVVVRPDNKMKSWGQNADPDGMPFHVWDKAIMHND